MIKAEQIMNRKQHLNIILYKKPRENVHKSKSLKVFPLRSGTKQAHLLPSFLFNPVLEVIARAIRQEKE
jgi:hypothetical protein